MRAVHLIVPCLALLPLVAGCPLDLDAKKEKDAVGSGGNGGFGIPGGFPDGGPNPWNPFSDAGLGTGGVTGAGGGSGTGGRSNTGGASGTGGTPAASGPCRVKCMDDLVGKCTPVMGTCVSEVNLEKSTSNVCYSNGVKYYTSVSGTTSIASYVNPDGTTCYIQETPTPATDFTKVTAYWKDGSGKLVATQMVDTTKKTASYLCADGTSYQLGPECWGMAIGSSGSTTGSCTMGTCR